MALVYDQLGNIIGDDGTPDIPTRPDVDAMRYELQQKSTRPQMSIAEAGSNFLGNASNVLKDYEKKLGLTNLKNIVGQIPVVKAVQPLAEVPISMALSVPAAFAYGYVPPGSPRSAYDEAQAKAAAIQYQSTNPYTNQMLEDLGETFKGMPAYIPTAGAFRPRSTDARVLRAQALATGKEIGDINADFISAQSGPKRMDAAGNPTYGASLQQMASELDDYVQRQKARGKPSVSILGVNGLMPDMKAHAMPIGPKSMLWDESRKDIAVDMEAKGYTPQEIFSKTLTTRGLDPQHWEQFIPSDEARIRPNDTFKNRKNLVLSDILHYPQLYEAYPWLESYKVAFSGMGDTLGEHDSVKKRITFNNSILDDPKNALGIIAHEPAHAIQWHENWPLGGSPEQFPSEQTLSVASSIHDLMNEEENPMSLDRAIEFTKLLSNEPVTDQQVKDAVRLVQHGQANVVDFPDPYSWYQHLSGEQQAWLPSKLWGKNESQLRQSYPYSKEVMNMDPNKAIIRKGKMPSGEATYVTSGDLHQQLRNKQAPTFEQMKAELQVNNEQPSKEMATKPKDTVNLTKRKLFGLDLTPKQDQLPAVVTPNAPTSTELTTPTTSSEPLNTIQPIDYAVDAIKNTPVSRRTFMKVPVNAAISHVGKGLIGDPVKAVSGMLKKEAMKHALRHLENVFGDYGHPLMDGSDAKWDTVGDFVRVNRDLSHGALSRLNDVPEEHYVEHFTEKQLRDAYDEGARAWGKLWNKNSGLKEAADDAMREAISEIGVEADEYDLVEAAYPHFRKEMLYLVSQGHPENVTGELSSAFARSLIDMHGATAEAQGTTLLEDAASKAVSDFYNEQYNTFIENIINDEEGGGSSVSHISGMVGSALQPLQKYLSREEFKEIHQLYKQLESLPPDAYNADLDSNSIAVKLKTDFLSALDKIPLEDKTEFPFQALNFPATLLEQYENVMGVDTNKTRIDDVEQGLRHFAQKTGQEYEPFDEYYLEFRLENEKRSKEIKNIQNRLKALKDNEQNIKPLNREMAIKERGGNWPDDRLDTMLRQRLLDSLPTLFTDPINRSELAPNWEEKANDIGYSPEQKQRLITSNALNQWLSRRLKNYIKNDLGTPKDPVRDLADQGITHINDLGEFANDLESNLVVDRVIGKARKAQGQPAEGFATTALGRDWESRSDLSISPQKLRDWIDMNPSGAAINIGIEKALEKDPNAKMNTLDSSSIEEDLGFGHLTDELYNAIRADSDLPQHLRLSIKDLERMAVPEAVRLVAKINKYRKDLAEKATVKNVAEFRQNFPAVLQFEDGSSWHQLKLPDIKHELPEGYSVNIANVTEKGNIYGLVDKDGNVHDYTEEDNPYRPLHAISLDPDKVVDAYSDILNMSILDRALKEEGELMGHCVGGYCDDVADDESNIFTLRDSKGKPHVTIEAIPQHPLKEFLRLNNAILQQSRFNKLRAQLDEPENSDIAYFTPKKVISFVVAHFKEAGLEEGTDYRLPRDSSKFSIVQIKGKGNKEVVSRYRQQVIDFLNDLPTDLLKDVSELRNIDAVDTLAMYDPDLTYGAEIINAVKKYVPDLPRFIPRDEWKELTNKYYINNDRAGFKDGGKVRFEDAKLPIRAHNREFETPDLMKARDIGLTGDYQGKSLTLGRQQMRRDFDDASKLKRDMDYIRHSQPMLEGRFNAMAMKDPTSPAYQGMAQYEQPFMGGTAGIGAMAMRTPEEELRLKALQLIYNKQLNDDSSLSGMANFPIDGAPPMVGVQYRSRFADGGAVSVDEMKYALMRKHNA